MDTTGYVALSRQMVLQRHMTTIANNIANAGTTGYRAEHTLFEQALARPGEPEPAAFVQDVGLYRDTRPGAVTQTGNQFDLAINGEGYLSFQTPAGERYGRAGHLQPDATGRLTDAAGNPVLDDGGTAGRAAGRRAADHHRRRRHHLRPGRGSSPGCSS